MDDFINEVKNMPTADIMLILDDQLDLYTDAEISILRKELNSRPNNAIELEERERERLEEIQRAEKIRQEKETYYRNKIHNLKNNGVNGYYEYRVISLLDEKGFFNSQSGRVDVETMTHTLNELGLDGWHLITAYSNELGKNAFALGIGGAASGINSTIDENILIFERFVQI